MSADAVPAVTDETWEVLRAAAKEAAKRSYSPYSHYPVGVAAITDTGAIVTGANVENASYGLTLCAECALVSKLYTDGLGTRLIAFACVDGKGEVLTPCGRCRQLLFEHGGPSLLVDHQGGPVPMTYLLPDAFGPDHLEKK